VLDRDLARDVDNVGLLMRVLFEESVVILEHGTIFDRVFFPFVYRYRPNELNPKHTLYGITIYSQEIKKAHIIYVLADT